MCQSVPDSLYRLLGHVMCDLLRPRVADYSVGRFHRPVQAWVGARPPEPHGIHKTARDKRMPMLHPCVCGRRSHHAQAVAWSAGSWWCSRGSLRWAAASGKSHAVAAGLGMARGMEGVQASSGASSGAWAWRGDGDGVGMGTSMGVWQDSGMGRVTGSCRGMAPRAEGWPWAGTSWGWPWAWCRGLGGARGQGHLGGGRGHGQGPGATGLGMDVGMGRGMASRAWAGAWCHGLGDGRGHRRGACAQASSGAQASVGQDAHAVVLCATIAGQDCRRRHGCGGAVWARAGASVSSGCCWDGEVKLPWTLSRGGGAGHPGHR